MTAPQLSVISSLMAALLHGAGLGGLVAAGAPVRSRALYWRVTEPWMTTASGSLLGAALGVVLWLAATAL